MKVAHDIIILNIKGLGAVNGDYDTYYTCPTVPIKNIKPLQNQTHQEKGINMEFIKGMDISFLPQMQDLGAKFLDETGKERNIFELLKENGVNSIRLRIWNEPENVPESGGYCNLEQTVAMARKVKQYGMSFFLDFHYSDWWADPSKQNKPKAWIGLNFEELKQAVYDYTREVLLRMDQEKVFPEMVQIGNEIRSGMLFPDGEVPNYKNLVALINAGIRAVRDVSGDRDTKVVIHLDQGGRFFYLCDWFDAVLKEGLDPFDIIGVSYYPFWHGTFFELKDTLVKLVKRYGKPIIIAETAHPWRRTDKGFIGEQQEKIAGFPATPEGQRKVINLVMNITASLGSEMGLGIYYWEPAVVPSEKCAWSSNMGIFDENGKALPALKCFQYDRSKIRKDVAKIYEPEPVMAEKGIKVKLPEYISVLFYDGSCPKFPVEWEKFDNNTLGKMQVKGYIPAIKKSLLGEVIIKEKLEENHNYIPNAGFERELEGWNIKCENEKVKIELHPDTVNPFPAPPINYLYVESPVNFKFEIENTVRNIKPGIYRLQAEYRGTNTTGVDVRLFAQTDENKRKETIIYPADEEWTKYEISDIEVWDGQVKIGLWISSPPVYGKLRNFTLVRQEKST
ncbi:MAG: Arabinogalactan endo-beta-1,4-galactanase [Lachnoclostridium sp.]